jgi:N-acetylneuraminate synthase
VLKKKKPFLIAEIGINHNGSISTAKKMIDLAKKYNFNAVKFQKRDPEVSTPDTQKNKMRDTPWGYISYLDYKKKIEFNYKEFKQIDEYCKKIKIYWFASAWDINSQTFLKKFKCKYNKIASAMLTNEKLLEVVSKEKKHTFISTGMSNMQDIKKCVKIFKKNNCKFTLLHCVSTYPCKEENLNLNMITSLKKIFKCPVGYSGHESSVSPSIMAAMLGAEVIERHITINRSMWGTDQSASLSEEGLKNLTSIINKIPKILGNGKKNFSIDEKHMLNKFRYW